MNIKKSLVIITLTGLLLGTGFYFHDFSEVTAKADATTQRNEQGKIIVHYVDQSGKQIRPETVATGTTGTTYVASVPQIKGYTYSSIENGQNNANGPQMTFGGGDPVTSVMSMTIVYNATSSKTSDSNKNSDNNSSNTDHSGSNSSTTAPANNGKSSPSNKQSSKSSSNKNNSNSKLKSNKQTASNSNDNKVDHSDNNGKPSKTTNAKKNNNKKAKNNHHLAWTIGGVILAILVVITVVWKFMKKPSSDRH